jgi:chromosome segregation ATPase
MLTIIKEIESAIEKAAWNVDYHQKQVLAYSEQLQKLKTELQDLNELLDESLPSL